MFLFLLPPFFFFLSLTIFLLSFSHDFSSFFLSLFLFFFPFGFRHLQSMKMKMERCLLRIRRFHLDDRQTLQWVLHPWVPEYLSECVDVASEWRNSRPGT